MNPTLEFRVITFHHYELGDMFLELQQRWTDKYPDKYGEYSNEWRKVPSFDEAILHEEGEV